MIAGKNKIKYLNPLYYFHKIVRAIIKSKNGKMKSSDIGIITYPYLELTISIFVILLLPFSNNFYVINLLQDYALLTIFTYITLKLTLPIITYGVFPRNYDHNFVSTYTKLAKIISFSIIYLLVMLSIIIFSEDINTNVIVAKQSEHINIYLHFPIFVLLIANFINLKQRYYTSHSVDFIDNSFGVTRSVKNTNKILEFFIYSYGIILMFFGGWKEFLSLPSEISLLIKIVLLNIVIYFLNRNVMATSVERIMRLTFKRFVPFLLFWVLLMLIIAFIRG